MKARITRDPTSGTWVATRPRFGFGDPETQTFPTHQAALQWVDRRIGRQGSSVGAAAERSTAVHGMQVLATPRRSERWW